MICPPSHTLIVRKVLEEEWNGRAEGQTEVHMETGDAAPLRKKSLVLNKVGTNRPNNKHIR